ncbi:MAG TPA: EF-hand domain-containing protein [Pirellulales bacterium]|nr:EF-hand domain-containing protein [Pirellulales bacterium]
MKGRMPICLAFVMSALSTRHLTADEAGPLEAGALLKRVAAAFAAAARDHNQYVTRDEFVESYHAPDRDERIQRFDEVDPYHEGKLDRGAFLRLLSPTDERGRVADPIADLEQSATARWQAVFAAAGGEGKRALTRDDWPAQQIVEEIPLLAGVTFDEWDKNSDGKVDGAEGRWLLAVAFGSTQPDGRPIRTSTGRVFAWYYFRAIDRNGDGFLSRAEFVSQHHEGREKSEAIFARLDRDRDDRLSVEETRELLWHDTLAHFFFFDRDADGFLSPKEFDGIGWGASIARRCVPAFDENGDGKISFPEYRTTMFANEASNWYLRRRDVDHDGRLSFPEFYQEKSPVLIAHSRYFFDRFDLDRDGFLSLREFDFEADFARADANRDGELTLEEFLAPCPDAERADRRRRFLVFDFDANGKLDAEEFESYASPVDERKEIPDPMREIRDTALGKWEAILAAADANRDGALSSTEWPAKRIAAEIPALAEVPFALWDRRSDGQVDRADACWLFDVAYGLTQLDGRPLRTSTGRVFSWYYFRNVDGNGNGLVSREEFAARHHQPNSAETFALLDADGDGNLTDRETWSWLWHDTIGEFFAYDRDHDGYLTSAEMLGIGWGRYIARACVPAFDDDGDGKLSFREFRQTTFANQASDWPLRRDSDGDGLISWSEFCVNQRPLLIGQSRFFFDHFDRNRDGFLSPLEYAVENNPNHAQLLAYLDRLEQCLPLEVKVATQVCGRADAQAAAIELAARAAIVELTEEMDAAMRNSARGKRTASGNRYLGQIFLLLPDGAHSPHVLLRRKLSAVLQARLSAADAPAAKSAAWDEAIKSLDAETVRAVKRRRRAAALAQVAVLDDALLLSKNQRQELCELLCQDESDRWWTPMNSGVMIDPIVERLFVLLSVQRLGYFTVPEDRIAKILTSAQSTTFKESQQPQQQEVVVVLEQAAPAQQPGLAAPPGMAGPPGRRRVVRRGPTLEVEERGLARYVEQRLDEIDAACGLSPSQRDKLSLAARLDVARWREERTPAPAEKLKEGEKLVVQQVQAQGGTTPLPLNIFDRTDSYFRRSLQGRLPEEQRRGLEVAARERREFQRQALVEAIVIGFERAASLTGAQCEALANLYDRALADLDTIPAADWRAECMLRVIHLSFDQVRPLVFDFQVSAAERRHAELADSARQFRGWVANGVR